MKHAAGLSIGAGLFGTALLVAAGDIFLWNWERGASGHSDILARGPFLLSLLLPYFLAAALGIASMATAVLVRRRGGSFARPVGFAAGAVLVGFALAYLEPTGLLFRIRAAFPGANNWGVRLGLDALAAAAGYAILARSIRPGQAAP